MRGPRADRLVAASLEAERERQCEGPAGAEAQRAGDVLSEREAGIGGHRPAVARAFQPIAELGMNGIDVRRWLKAWLTACAKNGGKPPDDLSTWLPWSMSERRKRKLMVPE